MDLATWAFNSIDRIFSTMRSGEGRPACHGRTDPVGYVFDSWSEWRPVCLAALSVEDVEDVYLLGIVVAGFLLFGLGGILFYHEYKKSYVGLCRHVQKQNQLLLDLSRKLDARNQADMRAGTTWMQEIVPLIMSGGDPASVETLHNWARVPWLEESLASTLNLEERPSPRMFATHFQYNMMPASFYEVKPRVIYVMRNPKDVFTSAFYYYEITSFLVKPGPQSEFLQKFLDGKVIFGSWFDHVKSWLSAEDKERIMYISYEEMSKDLKDSVTRIAQFLEKPLDTEVIEKIADRCLFKNMKKNNMSNYSTVPREFMDQTKSEFLRKGVAGDWKNQLTAAEAEHFDAVYKDKMKDVKYKFAWD